jgi:hypothetical protein
MTRRTRKASRGGSRNIVSKVRHFVNENQLANIVVSGSPGRDFNNGRFIPLTHGFSRPAYMQRFSYLFPAAVPNHLKDGWSSTFRSGTVELCLLWWWRHVNEPQLVRVATC